jgi:phage-related baseplate assembly protein
VLLPLLRSAGYRVTFPEAEDAARADVMIACSEGAALPERANDMPVIRLTAEPDPGEAQLVYRYDRARLLEALRAGAAAPRKSA